MAFIEFLSSIKEKEEKYVRRAPDTTGPKTETLAKMTYRSSEKRSGNSSMGCFYRSRNYERENSRCASLLVANLHLFFYL